MLKFLFSFFFFSFFSCSHSVLIGDKDHSIEETPNQVIWFQIAGLDWEHFALLKFPSLNDQLQTAPEKAICTGEIWQYSLSELRPTAFDSFFTQLSGSSLAPKSCKKEEGSYLWNYFQQDDYKNFLFETYNQKNDSLSFFLEECDINNAFESVSNLEQLKTLNLSKKSFVLVRDFMYRDFLKRREFKKALNWLSQLNDTILSFYKKKNRLILVTSSSPVKIEYPKQGKKWGDISSFLNIKRSGLVAPLFAMGAGSERFCGFYNEASLFSRFSHKSKKKLFFQ